MRDSRAALTAIAEARAALEGALSELPSFTAACEQQQRATDAQTQVEAMRPRPRRKDLKAARALVSEASTAAQRRDWAAMRDGYAKAAEAFIKLEQPVEAHPPRSPWPRLAAVAAVVALILAAMVLANDRAAPRAQKLEPTVASHPSRQEATVATQPEATVAPQLPLPQPWSIASAKPIDAIVTGRENQPLTFAIEPTGGAPGTTAKVEWSLDKTPVQTEDMTWTYTPDFDTAGAHIVEAKLDRGESADQVHNWKVQIEDVNRPPELTRVIPPAKGPITAKVGDNVVLTGEATDPDRDDRLTYRWTVDGKPDRTDGPQLNLKVGGNHAVGLTVSDGKSEAHTSWQIAALSPLPPFVFEAVPKQLETELRFKGTAEFALKPTHDLSLADVSFTWTLDGRKVSDRPTFSLQATDSTLVRGTPVKLVAVAADKQGRSFPHDWKVTVLPPVPEIQSTTPPSDKPIDAESGQTLAFQVTAAPTVGNQQLTYIYSVDGKNAGRSPKSQFEFGVPDSGEHQVGARVEDNYRQAAPQTVTWRVQGSDILSLARKWVSAFQEARRSGDAQKEGQLRDLSATEVSRLKDAYSKQKDRQVSFTAPQIEKLAGNRAQATFTMTQSFELRMGNRSPDVSTASSRWRAPTGGCAPSPAPKARACRCSSVRATQPNASAEVADRCRTRPATHRTEPECPMRRRGAAPDSASHTVPWRPSRGHIP